MRLFEHPDFDQAILQAADHFKSQGLRPAIIEKDYYVTEVLRIIAATVGDKVIFKGGKIPGSCKEPSPAVRQLRAGEPVSTPQTPGSARAVVRLEAGTPASKCIQPLENLPTLLIFPQQLHAVRKSGPCAELP